MKYGALDSIPRETNINGQFHQLSYIRPDEAELLKSMGGAGTPGPGGIPQYGLLSWANENLGTNFNTGGSTPAASTNNNNNNDQNIFQKAATYVVDTIAEVVTLGAADTSTYNSNEPSNTFVTDAAQIASDSIKEVISLGTAETKTYNSSDYNLNYDATGGNTASGNTTAATTTGAIETVTIYKDGKSSDVDAGLVSAFQDMGWSITPPTATSTADAYKEYADSMTEAGLLDLGGKQMPAQPDNIGNTPILKFTGTGSDGEASYEVVGGLDADNPASMSYNEDGTLFVPYDGQDPNSIDANTQFYGSTDPNAADYNMSLDLAQTGSYVNLDGDIVEGDPFKTDLPVNGAAILNELGKDHLLKTGDDSKMITTLDGGGYTFLGDDKKITDDVFEEIIDVAIEEELLPIDILGPVDEDPPIVLPPINESQPYSTNLYGSRDIMGDFYGGRSGGIWDRFSNSYLTRFGYSPEQFNEMIRKVENPDGSTNFFGADGALINPESIGSNYRIFGDPTTLKIGEEQTTVGQQNYDAQGNLIDTTYYEGYGAQDLT